MSCPSILLNSGFRMPLLGLGTCYASPKDTYRIVKEAIKLGYRHIDTASIYYNEVEVGQAVNECIQEGIIKREDIFITTKLWVTFFESEDVEKACQQSLKDLNLDYIDLYLMHKPFEMKYDEDDLKKIQPVNKYDLCATKSCKQINLGYNPQRVASAWKAMEDLVTKGYTHSIGVSSFTVKKTEELLKTAKIIPAVNQTEFTPTMQQPTVTKYSLSKGIYITSFSQFGRLPTSNIKGDIPLLNPIISSIGKKYNKSNAQIILRFLIQQQIVAIPKTVTSSRLAENFNIFDFEIDQEDMKTLVNLDRHDRFHTQDRFLMPGITYKDLWDNEDCELYN